MKGKHRKEILAIAEAICNAMPHSPGCIMTEKPECRCTEKNCRVYPVAFKAWETLNEFWATAKNRGAKHE